MDWPAAWAVDGASWCANLVAGRELARVVDQIAFEPGDFVVEKKRFSGFYNTNLTISCARSAASTST
jgi:isochorismate hydrolase